ncbi:MAG: TonB-dependent receptor [Tannerella sp.]|jgi:TonB-linked SusC/RagA family outer membrane protein|nr:TonB-dependent receptor [Tannerella sp.]
MKKLLLFLFMLPASLTVQAQNQKITFSQKQITLRAAFEEIEKQTDLTVTYNEAVINVNRNISVNVSAESLPKAMDVILKGTQTTFKLQGKQIIIVPAPETVPERKYSGTVTDRKGETVIGASITVKGTQTGTATDMNGRFSIQAFAGSILQVSYIGFASTEVKLGNSLDLQIIISEDQKILDEVVVVGYGVQNKRDVSTSISQLKANELIDVPISDFRQALAGKLPGVQILQTSGDPEGVVSIRVRGISSVNAGNDPLYVVDGMPIERGFANLNNNDIESVEILKDASAAAIYGSRGSNGVVIITTKQGNSEKLTVKYDGYYGVQKVSKKLPLMNAYQFAETARDGHNNAYLDEVPNGSPNDPNSVRPQTYHQIPDELIPYLNGEPGLTDTDWQDAIFRTAISTDHNVSLAGKSSNISYFVSGNYHKQEGIIIESDFEKYGLRLNLDGNYDKFRFGVNFAPSYSTSNRVSASGNYDSEGIVQSALAMPPVWPVYNPDSSYNFQGNGYWRIGTDYQHNAVVNPVALARLKSDVVDRYMLIGKVFGEYEFIKGLTYNVSLGGDYYGSHNDTYRPSELPLVGHSYYGKLSNPTGYSSSSFYFNWLIENKINYETRINDDHHINAILVQSAQKETLKSNNVTATDYPNDNIQTISGGTVTKGNSEKVQWSLASYLARVQYSYQGRYMASVAMRTDGSSRFGKNNRWGYFPSASAAWRISDENFFKEAKATGFVDDLKLRTSYGVSGNFQIGDYEHLSTMSSESYILGAGDGVLTSGYKPDNIKNDDLSWEKTAMINVGIDLQMFKGLLGLTVEYYNSNTTDMLLSVPIPHTAGHSTALVNIGKVNNRGVEIQLNSHKNITKDLKYNFSANFSKNINEVKALGAGDASIISTGGVAHAYWITEIGKPIGSYYVMIKDGIFKNEEELKMYPHFANTQAGDFRFVDVDGDGIIDMDKDRAIAGNYMPDFTYGFNGTISYRDFDLGFAFQGVYGNEILNLNRRYIDNLEGNTNGTIIALNRWQSPENPGNGEVNRANRKQKGNNGRTSTWHLEDGSYLRLQNITLGYTLPQSLSNRLSLRKLRLYLSGQNLFTWTDYTGYNPEVNRRPTNALTPGEDYGTYPLAKVFTIGLNITF